MDTLVLNAETEVVNTFQVFLSIFAVQLPGEVLGKGKLVVLFLRTFY